MWKLFQAIWMFFYVNPESWNYEAVCKINCKQISGCESIWRFEASVSWISAMEGSNIHPWWSLFWRFVWLESYSTEKCCYASKWEQVLCHWVTIGPAILSAPAANLPTAPPPPPDENTINAAATISLSSWYFLNRQGCARLGSLIYVLHSWCDCNRNILKCIFALPSAVAP